MKKINVIICHIFVLMLASSFANAESYYISPSGNDNNSGSLNSPWKTVDKANAILRPGDIVYFRAGTYNRTIKPSRSGLPGKYITYSRYNNESVVFTDLFMGADLSNKSYIVIDGIKMLDTSHIWIELAGAQYNIVRNCHLEEAGSWAGIAVGEGAKFNKIQNNTIIGNCGPADLILLEGGSNNLIEGNDLRNGTHNTIGIQYRKDSGHLPTFYNVIRNNKVRNIYHTGISNFPDSHYTLIEGNTILDSGEEYFNNACGSDRDRAMERKIHSGIKLGASHGIVRNNILVNNGTGIVIERKGEEWDGGSENYIYNNTFNENYLGLKNSTIYPLIDNVVKNNIFFENKENEIFINNNESYYYSNNIKGAPIYKRPDGNMEIGALELKYPDTWSKNKSLDPQFKDKKTRNFSLNETSLMIDAGDFLTKTTNSGSGNALSVEDAGYFMDGWGIIEGDLIQLQGQKITARITKINGNTLTLDKSLTWKSGQGVSLAYGGSAPEIGAFEVDAATPVEPVKAAPVIKNPGDLSYIAGTTISLQIDASDPNEGDKITFSATGLPTSLSIDAQTGLISGVVHEGSFAVKITAKDQNGLSDEESFMIIGEKARPIDPEAAIFINAGGEFVDFKGEKWSGDQYAKGGKTYTNGVAIAGTENDKIYQTARYGVYTYDIPVANGIFDIKLHFAETYFGVNRAGGEGSRIFNVKIENGQAALQNYDIVKRAGGSARAIIEAVQGIKISDGSLTISLEAIKDNPKLSAIEILPVKNNLAPVVKNPGDLIYEEGAAVSLQIDANDPDAGDEISYTASGLPASLTINAATGLITGKATQGTFDVKVRATDQYGLFGEISFNITVNERPEETNQLFTINAGGGEVAYKSEKWASDQYAKGGKTYSKTVSIAGTENDKIYQTNRYGNYTYEIPVKKGTYNVKLHFAEIYFGVNRNGGVGSRVFNVDVEEGQGSLVKYDIVKSAGGSATAVVEEIQRVSVSDGFLTISLTSIKDNAMLSGIEISSNGAIENAAPVVKNPGDMSFEEESAVSLQLEANDHDGDKIDFSAEGLPAGLSIDTSTGMIQGTAKAGMYSIKIRVTDPAGLYAETKFNLTVKQAPVLAQDSYKINSGAGKVVFNDEIWESDQNVRGGRTYSNAVAIAGTDNDRIYQTNRYGNVSYEIPVSKGTYDLRLHFAEIYFGVSHKGGVGSRVFNVHIENGQDALKQYDIFERAGGAATAVIENISGITVSDGYLTISLEAIKENPTLSAIEVISYNKEGVTSKVADDTATKLNVYPNPFEDRFTINFGTPEGKQIELSIFDNFGNKVYHELVSPEDSTSPHEIDLSNIDLQSNEVYFLQTIENGQIIKYTRVIKK